VILLIDNYDSFTYNLKDYFLQIGLEVETELTDRISVEDVRELHPEAIVLSPGPGTPAEAGSTMALIEAFYKELPILGICLGHQALGEFFGARLVHGPAPVHGKTALVRHRRDPIFEGLPNPFQVMRYHSLIIEGIEETALTAIGWTNDGILMGLRHRDYPLYGLQFHPESILTPQGLQMLENWSHEVLPVKAPNG
jgi:anthranilate synthase/aminodeoxychorismate synthase-like glutamine amidotransferase